MDLALTPHTMRMKNVFPYIAFILFIAALTGVVIFLTYAGLTDFSRLELNGNDFTEIEKANFAYQGTVVSLLLILTFCAVYHVMRHSM